MKCLKNNLPRKVACFCLVVAGMAGFVRAQSLPATNAAAASGKNLDLAIADFGKLAGFTYVVSDTPLTNQVRGADVADKQIPAEVKALDLKKVTITGYMMPLKEQGDKTTEFLIMRTQSSCCFGIAPNINELVTVKAAPGGVPTIMDDLVQIQGTLRVGTVREDGYIVGIYQMEDGKFIGKVNK